MKLKLLPTLMLQALGATAQLTPSAPCLSLEDWVEIVASEASQDFDFSEETSEAAEALWQDATAYEWKKAGEAEALGGPAYPYIICNTEENESGFQRKLGIYNATKTASENFKALSNTRDMFCALGQVMPSNAASVNEEGMIVQPVLPSMKFLHGTLDYLLTAIENANNDVNNTDYHPTIDVLLCPTILSNNFTFLPQDWTSKITASVMEAVYPSDISEAFYLTSQEFINTLQSANATNATQRAEFWKANLEEYQASGQCGDIFNNRLTYYIDPLNFGLTLVEIFFNTTGTTELDHGCMLLLFLGLAVTPDVCVIETRQQYQPLNTNAQWLIQSGVENERPFFEAGLDGEGQVVAVSDTGIDTNNCYFWDLGHNSTSDIDLSARKIVQYIPFVDDSDYTFGHGTHVCGSVAGKRALTGTDESNGAADGVAPGAKIAFMDIANRFGMITLPRYSALLNTGRPYAKIHSASWGAELNFYTLQSRIFDDFMYANDDFLILVAAGNSGDNNTMNTVGAPATGKNLIAVGAHQNVGNSAPLLSVGFRQNVAGFSSRGPTRDGRTKPDIMAPGQYVLSAGARPREIGECDPADGSLPLPLLGKDGLLYLAGTSMACPITAGTAAIVRQYFEQGFYPTGKKDGNNIYSNPSSALIKAVLMNGAQFMTQVDNSGIGTTQVGPYDDTQNFGRISLIDSVYLEGVSETELQVFDREIVADKESKTYNIAIDKSNGCASPIFSVTLIWNEEGSSAGCLRCLLNDLDLLVTRGADTYYPNGLPLPDRENNAERVIVDNVNDQDSFVVTVSAHNLAKPEQTYSLAMTGCFGGEIMPISAGSTDAEDSPVDNTDNSSEVDNGSGVDSSAPDPAPAPVPQPEPSAGQSLSYSKMLVTILAVAHVCEPLFTCIIWKFL